MTAGARRALPGCGNAPGETSDPAARTTEMGVRLRALRQDRAMTLDVLAEATGLDKGYLSRLERGLKNPSIATVLRLSEALEVPVAELFGERLAEHAVRVTRARDRLSVSPTGTGVNGVEALSRNGAALEAFVLHPASEFGPDGHAEHAGEELFFVLSGTVEVRFADRGFVLEAGDCAQFPGHLPHRIRRIGLDPAAALVAVARPTHGRRRQRQD